MINGRQERAAVIPIVQSWKFQFHHHQNLRYKKWAQREDSDNMISGEVERIHQVSVKQLPIILRSSIRMGYLNTAVSFGK